MSTQQLDLRALEAELQALLPKGIELSSAEIAKTAIMMHACLLEQQRWLVARGLKLSNLQDKAFYNLSWDAVHKEFVVQSSIEHKGITNPQLILPSALDRNNAELDNSGSTRSRGLIRSQADGRDIVIRVPTSITERYMHYEDLKARFTSLSQAVKAKYFADDSELARDVDAALQKVDEDLQREMQGKTIEQVDFKVIDDIGGKFIYELALTLARKDSKYSKADIGKYIDKLSVFEDVLASNNSREVLITAVRKNSAPGDNFEFMLRVDEPKSDISSNIRTLVGRIYPNWVHSTLIAMRVAGKEVTELRRAHKVRRVSAAVPEAHHKTAIQREQMIKDQLVTQETNFIRTNVLDKIIAQLNSGTPLDTLQSNASFMLISLLTPHAHSASGLAAGISNKALKVNRRFALLFGARYRSPKLAKIAEALVGNGNEYEHFNDTLQMIASQPKRIKLSVEDVSYIMAHIDANKVLPNAHGLPLQPAAVLSHLSNHNINVDYIVFNFKLNAVPGGNVKEHNQKNLVLLNEKISAYVDKISADMRGELAAFFTAPSEVALQNVLTQFKQAQLASSVKLPADLATIEPLLRMYTKFSECLSEQGTYAKDPILNNLVGSGYLSMMSQILAITPIDACKSAKDRTALQFCVESAMMFSGDAKNAPLFDPEFLLALVKFGPDGILAGANCNCPALALQISDHPFRRWLQDMPVDDPKRKWITELHQYLSGIHTREMGETSGDVFAAAKVCALEKLPNRVPRVVQPGG